MPKNANTIATLLAAILTLALLPSCGPAKKKTIDPLALAQAKQLVDTANMNVIVRGNYTDAEKNLSEAVALNPYDAGYWTELGKVRVRLKNNPGATDAYKKALDLHEEALVANPQNIGSINSKLTTLVLLGREKDARDALAKLVKAYPGNVAIQRLGTIKAVDAIRDDPKVRDFIVK